jgi:protein-tyrosine phosphatase
MRPDVYWIDTPGPGRLAVMAHPFGRERLEDDLRMLRHEGVGVIVSMLMPDEVEELGLEEEGAACLRLGMGFESLPVPDMDVPGSPEAATGVLRRLLRHLESAKGIAIHCRMGMGRSPALAAAALVLLGVPAEEALDRVSRARGLDVPTLDEQKDWVRRLAKGPNIGSQRPPGARLD